MIDAENSFYNLHKTKAIKKITLNHNNQRHQRSIFGC